MKSIRMKRSVLFLIPSLMLLQADGAFVSTNRVAVNARVGFNISGGFSYAQETPTAPAGTTPDGDPYNYNNGYVLLDSDGGDSTWYWGYDDSAAQVDAGSNEILMDRSAVAADSGSTELGSDSALLGGEIIYSHVLQVDEDLQFGWSLGLGYMPLSMDSRAVVNERDRLTTDRFAYSAGTTPPNATPGVPYQGTFNGPGFLIASEPSSSSQSVGPITGSYNVFSELDGYLLSTRFGPFFEYPLTERLDLQVSGGMSLGFLDVDMAWRTDGAAPSQRSAANAALLGGGFLGADLFWQVSEKWHLGAGIDFEYLSHWEKQVGPATYSLDFTRSYYATLGLLREF